MRTRPHVPRIGRRRKLRFSKKRVRKVLGKRSPKQIAAGQARKRAAKRKKRRWRRRRRKEAGSH